MFKAYRRANGVWLSRALIVATVGAIWGLGLASHAAAADAEYTLEIDSVRTAITFSLKATGHTVHGTALVSEGSMRIDPVTGLASGRIVVEADKVGTGNGSRDKAMHREVLESEKYPLIVFEPRRVEGEILADATSHVQLHGVISIHGADHPVVLPTVVSLKGAGLGASSTLDIPFLAWGMHDPSIWFLKVSDTVSVQIEVTGTVAPIPSEAMGS